MARDWSSLPIDIAASIALKLETVEDFIRFSSVCLPWTHASSLIKPKWMPASPTPWLLLSENTTDNPNLVRKLYNISSNKLYQLNLPQTYGKRCWGSAYGWVAMVGPDLNVELFNPITKAQIYFPSFEAISEKYENEGDIDIVYHWLKKLVVVRVSQDGRHEFVIIVLYNFNKSAAFAWHGDQTWTPIFVKESEEREEIDWMLDPYNQMMDIVVMEDNVFALYNGVSIVHWNVKQICCREIVKPIDYCPPSDFEVFDDLNSSEHGLYLVQSGDDLLMVLRFKQDTDSLYADIDTDEDINLDFLSDPNNYSYKTLHFQVYKLDHKNKSWDEIKDLGNEALFVGDNYSISVSQSLDKCLKRNRIYFTDDLAKYWKVYPKAAGLDMGIYDNKCSTRWPLYDVEDICPSTSPPIWFVPQF